MTIFHKNHKNTCISPYKLVIFNNFRKFFIFEKVSRLLVTLSFSCYFDLDFFFLFFLRFFILISYNSYAVNIAVFQYSLILKNSNQYKEFQKELNIFKEKTYNDLKKEEEKLMMKKKEIEDSKVLLTSSEFEKRISDYF